MRRVYKLTLGALLTFAILAFVVSLTGVDETVRAIGEAGIMAFVAMGVLQALFLLLHAVALSVLSRPIGHAIPLLRLFKATMAGMAANIVTPSTYLGGEPVKVMYIGRKTGLSYQELAGTILLAKVMEGLSFVLLLGVSVGVSMVVYGDVLLSSVNLPIGIALIAVAVAAIVISLSVLIALWRRRRPLTAIVEFLSRPKWAIRFFARLRKRTRIMEEQVSRTFREEGWAILVSLLVYVVAHAVFFLRPLIFFSFGHAMGLDVGLLSIIFVASQLLLAFQVTPSAVGTLDGGLIGVLAAVGAEGIISAPQCAAFLLCLRFWDLVVVGMGAGLAAKVGARLLVEKPTESEDGPRLRLWGRLKLLKGRPRRLYQHVFRKDYVASQLAKRQGECKRCGACCRMGLWCRHLGYDDEGLATCAKYGKTRPPNCRNYPINNRDLSERDVMLPDQPCGYTFPADDDAS